MMQRSDDMGGGGMVNKQLSLESWLTYTDEQRTELARTVGKRIASSFSFEGLVRCGEDQWSVAVYRHSVLTTRFCLVPGGIYRMGLTPQEIQAARLVQVKQETSEEGLDEFLRGCTLVDPILVPPFIVATHPITVGEVSRLIEWSVPESDDTFAFLSFEEAIQCEKKLGLELPSECQWEYACRGGKRSLFWWGDELPGEKELESLLDVSFAGANAPANNFGLVSLICGEWVADNWCELKDRSASYTPNLNGTSVHVVKAFAGGLWPWQDAEAWMQCATVARCGFCSEYIGASAAFFRLSMDLNDVCTALS